MENPRETSNEVFLYKVHGILSKLMPHNFPTMAQQFLELQIDNPEKLQGIVDVLFEKAIHKPKCCIICARLCHCMIPTNVRIFNENGTESKLTFYQVLCRKCQKELKDVTAEEMENQEKLLEILTQEIPEEEKKLKRDELVTEELERKAKFLKNVSFFVELFKRELVSENIMDECINTLLKSNDEDSYECLCKLLSTVGKDLDHPKAKPRMDNYFDQITKAMIEHNLSPKSRSVLEDIVNLRLNSWVPEEDSSEPKTNISKRKRKKGRKKALRAAKKTSEKKNDDAVPDNVSITETVLDRGSASVESVGISSIVPSQKRKDMVDNKENQKLDKGPMNMPPVLYTQQAILQQQQQQDGQPRMQQFYQRGITRPIRIQHPQPTSQPMYQSPPGVGVQQIIQVPGGGPQQYTVPPQQYGVPQVDYQTVPVGNQPMPYRGPAPQMSGPYNQVQYQNYSASASMPPPMYAVSPSQQLMILRGNPPMSQNMSGPQPYQQPRQEQQPTAPRKKTLFKIRDPNQDNKDITEEILSSGNAPTSGSTNLATKSTVSGQSSSSNTPPQESTSVTKNNETLRSVFAAQVAATLNDESESSKKTKVTIPQVATTSQTTKSTSTKSSIHTLGEVKITSIPFEKKTFRTVGLPRKDDQIFVIRDNTGDSTKQVHMLAGPSEVAKNLKRKEKTQFDEPVQLNKCENRWVPFSEAGKHLSKEEKKTEKIMRKLRGILNKLTPQKFETLIQQVLDLDIDTAERLEEVVDIIFEKAIIDPDYSCAYANMCRRLIPTNVKVKTKDGRDKTLTFRKILLNKCQKEFEKGKLDEINIHEKMDELLKQGLSEEELKIKKEELDQEERKGRRRTLGNIRFIGELFKLKMLTDSIMHDCITKLLKSNDEESYECLCVLLSTAGKDLDHPKAKPRMDQHFDEIIKAIEARKTTAKCRFMLQDVCELRQDNWIPRLREIDLNPKTVDQIHKEAAEQEKKMMLLMQQAKVHKRDGPSNEPRTTLQQNDETWTTVPGRQRNVNVDPKKFQDVKKRTNVDTESISLGPGGRGYGAWARGSSGGSGPSSGPSTPTEQEPRGNRFSALGGDARRVPGASRQGSGAGRQESRNQGPAGRRPPQTEREKALESVRTIVQTKPQQPPKQEERETVSPRPEEPEIPATRPPTVPSPPAAKVWTEEEVEHKTMGLIDEYHNIKDLKEAIECVKEIDAPQLRYKLVFLALNHSMEKHASERVLTASLMHALLKDKIITEESYIKGLEELLEFAEDMEIDIPHVWKYLGELIGITITDNGLPLTSLNESVEKMIKDKLKAAKLMAEVLISARSKADHKDIDLLWSQSGFSFSNFFSSKEEETQFLKKNNLESLATSSFSSSKQPQSLKVQELKIIIKESNEKVFEWIDGNVKDPKDPKFIRVLVKAVCEGCKKESDDSCDVAVFKIKSKLLQKYIDSNSSLELQALYALQALSVSLDHPPNFLNSFFNALYDEEVISEDAFFEWEKDDNPNESQGKGTAKSSTVRFFEWLRSAEEEKTEG